MELNLKVYIPTHMRMYAGSSPTSVDHREELI